MTGSDWRLAVDIGGTFTDVVAIDGDGSVLDEKVLTTPHDLLGGVQTAVEAVLERARVDPADIRHPLVHATTLVTNALLERRVAKTAMVTTAGFADLLRMRDERRFDMFDLQLEMPPPPIPRDLIYEIRERVRADGSVIEAPTEADIDAVIVELERAEPASVCIAFLNAYVNPQNERLVAQAIESRLALPVTTSSDIAPVIREYPRFVTAALNAMTAPILSSYLERFDQWLTSTGFRCALLVMLSSGGTVPPRVAARHPIRAVESGPAAGAQAGAWFSTRVGTGDLLCLDVGGTTAKACFVRGGHPQLTGLFEIARTYRHLPGSGWPVAIPSVDLIEIGAGGGSIATMDELGRLLVGPESAGADPGPACYGRGGVLPTVTDANVVLGFHESQESFGGDLKLDRQAAHDALARLAARASAPVQDVAAAVHELVNQTMAEAVRAHATDHGIEPASMPLLAFGGAGPVHACGVAELLGCSRVLFPPHASVLSAFGTLISPLRLDLATSAVRDLAGLEQADADAICEPLRRAACDALVAAGIDESDIDFAYAVDARYHGQATELSIEVGSGAAWPAARDVVQALFEEQYRAVYGLVNPNVGVELVTWRVTAISESDRPVLPARPEPTGRAARAAPVRFGLHDAPLTTTIVDRLELQSGDVLAGPALVQEPHTTVVLRPNWQASVIPDGTLRADLLAA